MKKYLILFLLLLVACFNVIAQEPLSKKDSLEINRIIFTQQDAWNEGNIDQFMQAYWKSEKLVFIGSSGVTYGWDKVNSNYKKHYPDKDALGTLKFTIVELYKVDKNTAFMIGKFHLCRTNGDVNGAFSLVWKKIKGEWVIISDHSSAES